MRIAVGLVAITAWLAVEASNATLEARGGGGGGVGGGGVRGGGVVVVRPAPSVAVKGATVKGAAVKAPTAQLTYLGPSDDPSVSPPKKARKGRPDAAEYSHKVWSSTASAGVGNTVSANTPYGKLTCLNFQSGSRFCSWD